MSAASRDDLHCRMPIRPVVRWYVVDDRLHLTGEDFDVGFLKHARVAAWHVESSDSLRCPPAPAEERITITLDVRLVVAGSLGGAKEDEFTVEDLCGSIALLRKQVNRSYWQIVQERRRLSPPIKIVAKQSHTYLRP